MIQQIKQNKHTKKAASKDESILTLSKIKSIYWLFEKILICLISYGKVFQK